MQSFQKMALSAELAIIAFLSCGKLFSSDVDIWQFGQTSVPLVSDITPKQHQLLNDVSGLSGTVYSTTGAGDLAGQCLLSVTSGDTENLRLTLANAPDGCRLKLTGTYELDGPLYVNRPLTAPAPQRQASDWFQPDTLVESQLGLHVLCSAEDGEMFCPGQQAGSPEAVIIVKQGSIHFTGEGGLHGVGIIDARHWPESNVPVLQISGDTAAENLSLNKVFLKVNIPWYQILTIAIHTGITMNWRIPEAAQPKELAGSFSGPGPEGAQPEDYQTYVSSAAFPGPEAGNLPKSRDGPACPGPIIWPEPNIINTRL